MNDETMNQSPTRPVEDGGRRGFLKGAGVAALGVAAAGLLTQGEANAQRGALDPAVLNFALNLEYLEAEFYLAAIGSSLTARGIGTNGPVTPPNTGNGSVILPATPQVNFAGEAIIQQYANEIANDEAAHVAFLRSALGGGAVARPTINLRESFVALGNLIGVSNFDPFASVNNFLLAAFVFEDVGVTAYKGGARFIANKDFLEAAAGILAVEAYHAGEIRTVLAARGETVIAGQTIFQLVQRISDVRDSLDGTSDLDQGIGTSGALNIIPTDGNALAFSRTTTQVLNIVYGSSSTTPGLFFPNGLNGAIR